MTDVQHLFMDSLTSRPNSLRASGGLFSCRNHSLRANTNACLFCDMRSDAILPLSASSQANICIHIYDFLGSFIGQTSFYLDA